MLALLVSLSTASALVASTGWAPSPHSTCGVLHLQGLGADSVASVLQRSWMEAGVKRGLEGAALCKSDSEVDLVCTGPVKRIESFARWAGKEVGTDLPLELDPCHPLAANVSPRFPLIAGDGPTLEATVEILSPQEGRYILRHLRVQAEILRNLELEASTVGYELRVVVTVGCWRRCWRIVVPGRS